MIEIQTNSPPVDMFISSASASGNLSNGSESVQTEYLLTIAKIPTGYNQSINGIKLTNGVQGPVIKLAQTGKYECNLSARLLAFASCPGGLYRDVITISTVDKNGNRSTHEIDIRAELEANKLQEDNIKSSFLPDNSGNSNIDRQIQFQILSDEVLINTNSSDMPAYHFAFLPIRVFVPDTHTPCLLLLTSTSEKNYFLSADHMAKVTYYCLTDAEKDFYDIQAQQWQNGMQLPSYQTTLSRSGEYNWNLWFKFIDESKSTYSNTLTFTFIDSKGKQQAFSLDVTCK